MNSTKHSQTKKKQIYPYYKSQTLNPQSKQNQLHFDDVNDRFLIMTASRAKRKLHDTTRTKFRLSLSANSTTRSQQREKSSQRSSKFIPTSTISSMVRKRHNVQQNTKKMDNVCKFFQQKFSQQYKKKKALQLKQSRIRQTISFNKSQKQLINSSITQYSQKLFLRNLHSHSQVIAHRQNLNQTLQKTKKQKQLFGQIGRKQTQVNHHRISAMKIQSQQKNKIAVERGRSQQQIYRSHKIQRTNKQKTFAEQNYKKKWMNQFFNKQKVQKQNRIRMRKIGKKLQNLLIQTQLEFHKP